MKTKIKKQPRPEFPKVVTGAVFLSICKCGNVFFTSSANKSCLECRIPRYARKAGNHHV